MKQDLEKEMFDLEQELDIPSNLRFYNSKPKQETLEEFAEREANEFYKKGTVDWNKFRQLIEVGAKWQQERICDSEVIQRIRATLSDAEARRIIRTI